MVDFTAKLKADLVEQFRDKPKIEDLAEVLGKQLQDIYDFYEEIENQQDVYTATGKQLDYEGDIIILSRKEAGLLAGNPIPFDVVDDETYRLYLIYKILKNTGDCTYPNIIKAFKMFWDKPLYYSEDPDIPATMIFDTGWIEGWCDTSPLFKIPLLRAAGVTLRIYARTLTALDTATAPIVCGLGYAETITELPELERNIDYSATAKMGSGFLNVTNDTLPTVERDYQLGYKLSMAGGHISIAQDTMPKLERNITYDKTLQSGSAMYSIMETPLNGIQKETE